MPLSGPFRELSTGGVQDKVRIGWFSSAVKLTMFGDPVGTG